MISVVVCTYNGEARIGSCLAALVGQENPPEYEIIVVDNASSDGTTELVTKQLSLSFSSHAWKIIREDNPGLLHARLAGLKSARYEWVLFCDDDNLLFKDFLFQCGEILSNNSSIGVLGSKGIPEFLGPKPEWFDQYAGSYAVGPQLGFKLRASQLDSVYGASSIYRKQPLLDLFDKGFAPLLSDRNGEKLMSGGDVEWCWIMQLLGYKVAYSAKLQFYHQLPASRLTWDYYLRLKHGISSSTGLLNSYLFYVSHSFRPAVWFAFNYRLKEIKSLLLYWKYRIRWKGTPSKSQDQLSYTILEARMNAFRNQGKAAFSHFKQLKQYFGA